MIDYNIISSSSSGNAVVINSTILIDCGVPWKAIQPYAKNLQIVLLTHEHGDHFNKSTIRKLSQDRPLIRFGCGEWLVEPLLKCGVRKSKIDVYSMKSDNIYHQKVSFIVSPLSLPHNVPNCGYIITSSSFGRLIYATDTSSLDGLEAPNFDLYLIEANYTEIGIKERIEAKEASGEYVYEYGAQENHLSKEACDRFLMANMGEHSEFVYMHQHKESKF